MAVEKKNIFLTQTVETMPYTSTSRPIKTNYPKRTVATHAAFIQKKLQECYTEISLLDVKKSKDYRIFNRYRNRDRFREDSFFYV